MKILYFAWLKDKTGINEEEITDQKITDVKELLDLLSIKYPKLKEFIDEKEVIRVAVNLNYITDNIKLNQEDEIALFPPVSGG
tara:strand:+ start:1350 stop:1598 length:249 start_codon:yes stop_codon:yes gene_type:complete